MCGGEPGDDNLGTLGIILAYVDDCNPFAP
jgi:hypothetical protein